MKNKTFIILFFVFCFWGGNHLFAQTESLAVSNIAPELLEHAHTVVRYQKMEIDIPSISKSVLHYKSIVTLLNENSKANVLVVGYDSFNKVGKIKGKIYDASGKLVRALKKSEFKDVSAVDGGTMYGDDRIINVEVSHGEYPYTVEFEYKKTKKKFMGYPNWYVRGFKTSIENANIVVNAFDENQLAYKPLNIQIEPVIKEDGKKRKYLWEVKNIKAIQKESVSPSARSLLPVILLSPKTFKLGEYKGTTSSWSAYGKFMHDLNKDRDQLPKEMKRKIHELTANVETDREKIDILYNYLQRNTRYVGVQLGVGGWQTFSAEYVCENEYGDCKALTNFMKSMLKEVGITSYPVLINRGGSDDFIREDFVYPSFNHVILNVPSEDYWLECTSNAHPPNYLGSDNENQTAFRYTESGGELVKTPDYKAEQHQEKNEAVITLQETGDAQIANDVFLSGIMQEWYRSAKFYLSQEDLEKRFLKSENFPSFSVNKYDITVSNTKPEVTKVYNINVKRYATKSGKRLFVPLNLVNPNVNVPPSTKKRIHPLKIKNDYFDDDLITINLPEGYKVESMPDTTYTLETDFGFYKVAIKVEGNQLIYIRKLKLISGEFPAERYEDYRNFRKEIGTRDSAKIVLVKKQS